MKKYKVGDLVAYRGVPNVIFRIFAIGSIYDYRISRGHNTKTDYDYVVDHYEVSLIASNNKLNKALYPDWIEKGEWLYEKDFGDN